MALVVTTCPHCGAVAGEAARFCGLCGRPLAAAGDGGAYAEPEEAALLDSRAVVAGLRRHARNAGARPAGPARVARPSYAPHVTRAVAQPFVQPETPVRSRLAGWGGKLPFVAGLALVVV